MLKDKVKGLTEESLIWFRLISTWDVCRAKDTAETNDGGTARLEVVVYDLNTRSYVTDTFGKLNVKEVVIWITEATKIAIERLAKYGIEAGLWCYKWLWSPSYFYDKCFG